MSTVTTDFTAIKARQQRTWSSGDFSIVGTTLQIVGESLCEAVDLRPGSTVLGVATGNGNASLAAARRWCDLTALDYVPALLENGARRAEADRLPIDWKVGDAEDIPFKDGSFDVVLSTFGVMFTPDQQRAASELLRVCRSGGRIGLANWTPDGFIGRLFKVIGKWVPPPAGVQSPARWGTRDGLDALFGAGAERIDATLRHFNFRYRSAEHFVDVFRNWYGPTLKAFEALPPEQQQGLHDDIVALVEELNVNEDGAAVVPAAYLEVVIRRR